MMIRYIGIQKRFWMQGFLLFGVFIGVGYHILCQKSSLFLTLSKILAILVIGIQIGTTLPMVLPLTVQNNYLEEYAHSELQSLPSGSIYIAMGDYQQNSMLYLHQIRHERSDVTVVYLPYVSYMWFNNTQLPLYDNINWPGTVYHPYGSVLRGKGGNAFNLTEFIKANLPNKRLFITSWVEHKDEPRKDYNLWPVGLFYEVRHFFIRLSLDTEETVHSWERLG